MKNHVLESAIKTVGSQVALAGMLNVKQPVISRMLYMRRVPAAHCLKLHEITKIPLHEIRPDIYPAPTNVEQRDAA